MYFVLVLGIIAFAISLVSTALVRNVFHRWGLVDRPDHSRKVHSLPVPRVGGIAILLSYLATLSVTAILPFSFAHSTVVREAVDKAFMLLPAIAIIFLVGLLDDLRGVAATYKLIAQVAAACLAVAGGVQIQLFTHFPGAGTWNFLLSVLWLVWCANAFNLIDGLDGLAAGLGLFATMTTLLAALTTQNWALIVVTIPLTGSLLGFLRYNFNPATIFLGDCGSLLIGFLVGCYGALWSQKSATLLGMTAPMMAASIPLLDASLSIVRRFLRHQPIFGADRGHIHHQLLDRGLTPRRVALLMYAVACVAATLSLLQSALENQFGGLIVVLFCAAAWIGIQHLGYVEFAMARQLIFNGTFRRIIDSQTRLDQFERDLTRASTLEECWKAIQEGSRSFGFQSVRMKLNGHTFDDRHSAPKGVPTWQVRVPLPDGHYVNFRRDFSAEVDPLVVAAFVRVVESALKTLPEARPQEAVVAIRETTQAPSPVARAAAAKAG